MRRMIDWTVELLRMPIPSGLTVAALKDIASRYPNVKDLCLTAVCVWHTPLPEVPQLLRLLTAVELVCGEGGPGDRERDAWAEGLGAAKGLTSVTLSMFRSEDLGLLRYCKGLRTLAMEWKGAVPLTPTPEALSHMPRLETLSCSRLAGLNALAFLQGAASLTRLEVQARGRVSLCPLAHLPRLRYLRLEECGGARLPWSDLFSGCLDPAGLGELEHLDLRARGIPVETARGLAVCTNLVTLYVDHVSNYKMFVDVLRRHPRLLSCTMVGKG